MDGHHKKSRHAHGSDVQKAELKSYDRSKVVKLLLKICHGVLNMPLDPLVLLIDFQQRDGLIVILAVNLVCPLELIPVVKKHSTFDTYTDIQCFQTVFSVS